MFLHRTLLACGLVAGLSFAPAKAGVIVTPGPGGGNPDENILFNTSDFPDTGMTVSGYTNNTKAVLDFTSSTTLVADGGQATISKSGGGAFAGVDLIPHTGAVPMGYIPMTNFTDLKFNIDAVSSLDDNLRIQVFLNGSGMAAFDGLFDLDDSGENFFRITSDGGDVITKVSLLTDPANMNKLEQVRLGGINTQSTTTTTTTGPTTTGPTTTGPTSQITTGDVTPVPEPVTLALWGALGGGMALFGRRRKAA